MSITLSGHGISVDLPISWEGRISLRGRPAGVETRELTRQPGAAAGVRPSRFAGDGHAVASPDATPSRSAVTGDGVAYPVTHLANFPLPIDRGDFGSGAVDLMGPGGVLIALVEYGPDSVGTPLFAWPRMPRPEPNQFRPEALQRRIPGQLGFQRFFTVSGRAFCVYVVIGSAGRARPLAAAARSVLDSTRIGPA